MTFWGEGEGVLEVIFVGLLRVFRWRCHFSGAIWGFFGGWFWVILTAFGGWSELSWYAGCEGGFLDTGLGLSGELFSWSLVVVLGFRW